MLFYPNPVQWRIIWTVVGVILAGGLFLQDLKDLSDPSVAAQKSLIAEKARLADLERERTCAEARALQEREVQKRVLVVVASR